MPTIKAPPATVEATAPTPSIATGATPSSSDRRHGLPLPFPNVLANPSRLGPPRLSLPTRKTLGLD